MTIAISRRMFLTHLGRGSIAVAVVGVAACVPGATSSSPSLRASGLPADPSEPSETGAMASPSSAPAASALDAVTWERVNLGFVSAYILVRGGEAAIVDTGVAGSEDEIGAALEGLGLDWSAVGHVVLTHQHSDHAGSAAAVLEAATDATGYAGAADIPAIDVPRPLVAVGDGDRVFDLRIVTTPGHTVGHVAVLDEVAGVLVAGDALTTGAGTVVGPNPQFSSDMTEAMASVEKLAGLSFETLLVGHGDPITSGAADLVAAFLAVS